jgi:hypothetical protein
MIVSVLGSTNAPDVILDGQSTQRMATNVFKIQTSKKKKFLIIALDLNGTLINNNSSVLNANSDSVFPMIEKIAFQTTVLALIIKSKIVISMICSKLMTLPKLILA